MKIIANETKPDGSTTSLLDHETLSARRNPGGQAKEIWQKLKDDDKQRKERVQHVSHADATAITGYGEDAQKKDNKGSKGDTRSLATLFFA